MNNISENIKFLKNFVQKRETYIRFSPLGTAIMGIMYILYYFFGKTLLNNYLNLNNIKLYLLIETNLFLGIGLSGAVIVTILSLLNSNNKKEELLPKSIRYIIINIIFLGITFFVIIQNVVFETISITIPISFIFYGLLIIVSRFCIPNYIKYFGLICFISGILLFGPLNNYTNEVILLIFGFGHLIISVLLKINNDKNE